MVVHNIYHLDTNKTFSEDEAFELVNLLLAITVRAKNKINGLKSRIEYFKLQADKVASLENELNFEVQSWSEKVRRLGALPLALYKVKIPGETGHYMWEMPSADITFHAD